MGKRKDKLSRVLRELFDRVNSLEKKVEWIEYEINRILDRVVDIEQTLEGIKREARRQGKHG